MKRIAFLVAQRLGLGLISLFVVTLFIGCCQLNEGRSQLNV